MKIEIRNVLGVDRAEIRYRAGLRCWQAKIGREDQHLRAIAAAASADSCPVHHDSSTQEKPRPAFKKKDYGQFVRLGADRASAIIRTTRGSTKIEWPSGDVSTDGTPPYSTPYAAGILQYGNLSDEARQAFLHRLLKAEPAYADFAAEAKDVGFEGKSVEGVWKQVEEYGWDQTLDAADKKGVEHKREWQNITGEPRWGAKKGDAYRPEILTDEALTIDEQILVALQEETAA